MVILHVKRRDESLFLFNTTVEASTTDVIRDATAVYNGRLKINRICYEMEEMAKYGTTYPPEILGLLEEQVVELGLKDDWGEKCVPSGGWSFNKDPVGRRNGKQPTQAMQDVFTKTIEEARARVSKKKVQANECLTHKSIHDTLDILRGATMIVYPMGLPPHEPIRLELENKEDLSGTQASLDVVDPALAQLWFSGKEILRGQKMKDFVGSNEKTKIIAKIAELGKGAPGREPVITEEEKKELMLKEYRRQEELRSSSTMPCSKRIFDEGCLVMGRYTGMESNEVLGIISFISSVSMPRWTTEFLTNHGALTTSRGEACITHPVKRVVNVEKQSLANDFISCCWRVIGILPRSSSNSDSS